MAKNTKNEVKIKRVKRTKGPDPGVVKANKNSSEFQDYKAEFEKAAEAVHGGSVTYDRLMDMFEAYAAEQQYDRFFMEDNVDVLLKDMEKRVNTYGASGKRGRLNKPALHAQ